MTYSSRPLRPLFSVPSSLQSHYVAGETPELVWDMNNMRAQQTWRDNRGDCHSFPLIRGLPHWGRAASLAGLPPLPRPWLWPAPSHP